MHINNTYGKRSVLDYDSSWISFARTNEHIVRVRIIYIGNI